MTKESIDNSVGLLLDKLYRQQTAKMIAYLITLVKDLSLAEEVWQETLFKALQHFQKKIPDNPAAWLATCAKNLAIDRLRHHKMSLEKGRLIQALSQQEQEFNFDNLDFTDLQLRLIFTCCHPAIAFENQIALTLQVVCSLKTESIANALLISKASLEQRLTRAKRKISQSKIPFSTPQSQQLSERLDAVLKVVYLIFNKGFNDERNLASKELDLSLEAVRLIRLMKTSLPQATEIEGLLALMLFNLSRRKARFDKDGGFIRLEEQNRGLWQRELIQEADTILIKVLKKKKIGSYQLQAAIQGCHANAKNATDTDWQQIEALYQLLQKLDTSPVIALNAAVATAFSRGLSEGLEKVELLAARGDLQNYSYFYSTKAYLLRRLNQSQPAIKHYQKAISLSTDPSEKSFYHKQIVRLENKLN